MAKFDLLQYKYAPHWANAGLFIIMLMLNLNISFSAADWKDLTDPYDYLHQSKISLTDKEFWFPRKTADFSPRPFTVPLFYKMCGGKSDVIVRMQMQMLPFSAFFLVAAFMLWLEKNSAKYFLMVCVYLLLGWWNVLGWCTLLLSESLSASLLFCWLASLLFLYKKNKLRWWLLHAVITILFAFTRDSWPYVLLFSYAVILWNVWWFRQQGVRQYAAMFILCTGIFFVQQQSSGIGLRYKLPVINSIVVRILPHQDYTAWFVKNGMPCADKLLQNFDRLDVVPDSGQHKLWSLYNDAAYQPFLNWVTENGQETYIRFMLDHPAYVLGADQTPAQLARVMSYNLFYIDDPRGYSVYIGPLFPLFNIGVVAVLCIMLMMIYSKLKNPVLFGPVMLGLFIFMNAVISYNADALEVERHLFITNVLVQLTGFWAVALIWDALKWRNK